MGAAVPSQEHMGPDHPWERVHMDLTGPFLLTDAEEWTRSNSKITSVDKYPQELMESLQFVRTTVGDLKPNR